jgi:glycerol-3-phosphate O-acyltransferase
MMPLLGKIKRWVDESRNYKRESLYAEANFPLNWLVKKVLSKIPFDMEAVDYLKKLHSEGLVIYALKDRSQLNSLIIRDLALRKGLPTPVYSHDVNMTMWQPFLIALRVMVSLLRRLSYRPGAAAENADNPFRDHVATGHTLIIHLGGSEFFENRKVEEALASLVDAQKVLDRPIYIVPVLVTYGRRREKEKESLMNILFGQTDNTMFLQRLITFLRYASKIFVMPTEAVELSQFIKENAETPAPSLIKNLRRELIERIDEEKTALVGSFLKSRQEHISMVLKEPGLIHYMENMAAVGKKDYPALLKEARKYLNEIAADYNNALIDIWARILAWLWNNIYDGVVVDREGMARIRNISKKMPFVIIPCHRSHIDYLLLSYVFYEHHIQLPFIAAGTNMAFGPFGYLFRKSGAFFLRRSFRGNPLYGEVFAKYLEVLIKEGLPIEFFIEGGRSRTGKMVMPKYGLLSMIIQAFQQQATDDLAAIPVYIGYDRVIEEKSYLKELGGAPKEQEKTTDVIKSSKVLRKRYGSVHVNIGEPIFLKSYLGSQDNSFADMDIEERQRLYRRIGYEIALSINKVSVVTPFALISAGLLSHDRRGISHDELMEILTEFYEYLIHRQVSLAATFVHREKAIQDALLLFDQSGLISRLGEEEGEEAEMEEIVYSLDDSKRLNLEYYKNNILHFFLPLSFVATSMLAHPEDNIPLGLILEDYRFLKQLFWNEFIFDQEREDGEEVNGALSYLHSRGMIAVERRHENGGAYFEVKGRGRTNLRPFAGLIENYIQSYWVVIRACAYLRKGPKSEKEWLKNIHKLGSKMFRKGEVSRAEALSQANYQNAMIALQEAGILNLSESIDKRDRKEGKIYSLNPDRRAQESLRRRLFRFL